MIQVRGYSEMTSPQNTKFQSPIPPMSPLVTFFIIPPPPMSPGKWWQTFSLIKDLKNNSTCLV